MGIRVDVSYKSLNKFNEELCGDKVELIKTKDSNIIILADGMGSGVKANILSTLTSKILGTMLYNGATIEQCVETIVKTLPVCQVRQVAYSTFSILQVFRNGDAYLVEFDNPKCIFIRDGVLQDIEYKKKNIEDKLIKEARFKVKINDCFVIISDGAIHAGVGELLNFGWTWSSVAEYSVSSYKKFPSASRLSSVVVKACDDLYMEKPGDDTTVAVARIIDSKVVNIITGPPSNEEDDVIFVRDFMKGDAQRIVSGGTTANIISRILRRSIKTSLDFVDPTLPPIGYIDGIELVTEGVLTLTRALTLMKRYVDDDINSDFFVELDKDNGGSKIAKMIIEDCTELNMFVGKAINAAHQNPELPFDLSIRMSLIEQMKETVKKMGKEVNIKFY